MTTHHSPGPWSVEHDWFGLIHVLANDERIIATLEKHNNDHAERQSANAALIRAAPAMLVALQTIALHAPSLDVTGIRELCDAAIEETTWGT
jgi:hypothetical protein